MKILAESKIWEEDFLTNKILPPGELISINSDLIKFYDQDTDVFIFCSRVHSYDEILKVVKKTKPKIIICLSDEFIHEDLSCFNNLGNYCSLFLRQYHHPNYTYTSNTIHIPLGYTNGCEVFSEEKQLSWSFFGAMKSDREKMLMEFKKISPYFFSNSISKQTMCKIYSKSFFVPCGRGNSSLDCFRIYEAAMNGAIPVIVGSKDEIEYTFKYEDNPPWIFAQTWEDALDICNSMLKNNINNESIVNWWMTRVDKIKNKVLEVL